MWHVLFYKHGIHAHIPSPYTSWDHTCTCAHGHRHAATLRYRSPRRFGRRFASSLHARCSAHARCGQHGQSSVGPHAENTHAPAVQAASSLLRSRRCGGDPSHRMRGLATTLACARPGAREAWVVCTGWGWWAWARRTARSRRCSRARARVDSTRGGPIGARSREAPTPRRPAGAPVELQRRTARRRGLSLDSRKAVEASSSGQPAM